MIAAFHDATFRLAQAGYRPPAYWWQVLPSADGAYFEQPALPIFVPAINGTT
jgi:hypothetical protein